LNTARRFTNMNTRRVFEQHDAGMKPFKILTDFVLGQTVTKL
jgi:hypothetical protein